MNRVDHLGQTPEGDPLFDYERNMPTEKQQKLIENKIEDITSIFSEHLSNTALTEFSVVPCSAKHYWGLDQLLDAILND